MRLVFILLVILNSGVASAEWRTSSGNVEAVITYAHVNTVIVNLSVDGADVEQCSNKNRFVVSSSIEPEARARMYSLLLAAKASGQTVTVTYDDAASCEPWDSNPSAYRRIVRLQ